MPADQTKGRGVSLSLLLGAGNRTRTCTLSQWNLNPPSLPIPPCPRILPGHFNTMKNLCQRAKQGCFGESKQKAEDGTQTFEQIPLTFPSFAGKIHVVLCTVIWGVWPSSVSFISGICREQAFCASWRFTCADILRLSGGHKFAN